MFCRIITKNRRHCVFTFCVFTILFLPFQRLHCPFLVFELLRFIFIVYLRHSAIRCNFLPERLVNKMLAIQTFLIISVTNKTVLCELLFSPSLLKRSNVVRTDSARPNTLLS